MAAVWNAAIPTKNAATASPRASTVIRRGAWNEKLTGSTTVATGPDRGCSRTNAQMARTNMAADSAARPAETQPSLATRRCQLIRGGATPASCRTPAIWSARHTEGRRSGALARPHPLMRLAVPAMLASVVLEIATYAVVSGAAWAQAHGGTAASLRGLDAVAFQLNLMILGPAGVAMLCAGAAMWASELFSRALPVLALLIGALLTLAGLVSTAPKLSGLESALSFAIAGFWVWMLWLGVLLWRRTPARSTVLAANPRGSDVTA